MDGGRNCARALELSLAQVSDNNIYDIGKVLDFGCGCGRTLLNWDQTRSANIVGCDVDHECIGWLNSNLSGREFWATQFDPPLPFETNTFDLVYAVSIFSHLEQGDQRLWLEELQRLIKPGGLALLTVQGPHAWKKFSLGKLAPRLAQHDLADEGIVYLPYQDIEPGGRLLPGIKSSRRKVTYGLTFMSPQYIATEWAGDGWGFERLDEGTVDDLQDVAVLRKRAHQGSSNWRGNDTIL
jgi:SAM-dependent methyltransferase